MIMDALSEILHPSHTGLIMVDMQNDFVSAKGSLARAGNSVTAIQKMLPTLRGLLDHARNLLGTAPGGDVHNDCRGDPQQQRHVLLARHHDSGRNEATLRTLASLAIRRKAWRVRTAAIS